MKVALVTNIASPYRLPMWNALIEAGLDLRVMFCADSHPDRIWDSDLSDVRFSYEFLPGWNRYLEFFEAGLQLKWSVWRRLAAFGPDRIVLTGFMPPTLLLAAVYGKLHDLPVVCWWGTHGKSSRFGGSVFDVVRRVPVRLMDGFLTYGTMATNYLKRRGVSEKCIVTGVNTVDVDRIARHVEQQRKSTGSERGEGEVRFLFVGQLIRRKGIINLLNAFDSISDPRLTLDVVGYGPLESRITQILKRSGDGRIHHRGGTTSLEATCRYYARADCLVMPSLREVWGLVVNEALAAGLYVVGSERAGAVRDLLVDAPIDAGIAVDPEDEPALVRALRMAADKVRSGSVDRESIRDWGCRFTPERYARSLISALTVCT